MARNQPKYISDPALLEGLAAPLKEFCVTTQGKISIDKAYAAHTKGFAVPTAILDAIKRAIPAIGINPITGKEKEADSVEQLETETGVKAVATKENKARWASNAARDREGGGSPYSGAETDDSDEEDIGAGNKKRTFEWLIDVTDTGDEPYNKRDKNGILVPLTEEIAYKNTEFTDHLKGGQLPDALQTSNVYQFWDLVKEVNGRPFYDAEENALGFLPKSHFLILPAEKAIDICAVESVGVGLKAFSLSVPIQAAIYVLAKQQAIGNGLAGEMAVRWAVLRLQAVNAGWFDNQPQVLRKPTPDNYLVTMSKDFKMMATLMKPARLLCCFIPYVAEYYFRQCGSSFSRSSPNEYISLVERIARSLKYLELIKFLEPAILYGEAFRWIGVKRVMEVLRVSEQLPHIPNVFQIRAKTPPAGQAVITTSAAVIQNLKQCNWWGGVAKAGDYEAGMLELVTEKIKASPWKYHILSSVYGQAALTAEEKREVEQAKTLAIQFAPILQAFIDAMLADDPLSNAKVLKSHATANAALYKRGYKFFKIAVKQKMENIYDLFLQEVFTEKRAKAIENVGANP